MPSEQLPAVFGNYVLLELIARGGMAEVYLAKMRSAIDGFEKKVALKRILPNLSEDDDFITMLIDEARIVVSLNHPNICQVYDLGSVEGTYYIAMEYIHGVDLSYVLKTLAKKGYLIPLEHALFITQELCAGLYCAHSKTDDDGNNLGIVHRDVSPHNMLVSFDGDAKIIDFGVAKASVKSGQTRMGVIKGKLLYMAPEQAMARQIDARADVFAAGLCLYKMLTGRLPFEADNEFQIYNNILNGEIAPPKTINPQTPDVVNDIVMKSLERDVEARYQDAWTMRQDISEALHKLYPGYTSARLSRFMNEYFADQKRKPKKHKQTSHPSKPSGNSYPSQPNTPAGGHPTTGQRNVQQPVAVNVQSTASPAIPRPEDLGFRAGSGGPEEGGADKTLDMVFDPDQLASLTAGNNMNTGGMVGAGDGNESAPTVNMNVDPEIALQAMRLNMANAGVGQPNIAGAPTVPSAAIPGLPGPPSQGVPPVLRPDQRQRPVSPHQRPPEKKGMSPILIALIVLVLLGGIGGAAAFVVLNDDTAKPSSNANNGGGGGGGADDGKNGAKTPPDTPDGKKDPPKDPKPAIEALRPLLDKAIDKAGREFKAEVVVSISTTPKGAEVFAGEESLGTTPVKLKAKRSNLPIKYILKLKGYQDEELELRPSRDRDATIELTKKGS